jgi:hypothetical protein
MGILLSLTACFGKDAQDAAEHAVGVGGEAGAKEARLLSASRMTGGLELPGQSVSEQPDSELRDWLERLAEQERSNGFASGAGLRESALREQGRDYADAVSATVKELFRAYSFAGGEERAQSLKSAIESGFGNMMASPADALSPAFAEADHQPVAEEGIDIRRIHASYATIRSRYETLPEYWHFGVRNMKGENIPACAEHAINLSPDGPCEAGALRGLASDAQFKHYFDAQLAFIKGINTAGQALHPPPAAASAASCGVLNPSFPRSLDHARASTVAISLRSSIKADKKSDRSQMRLAERLAYIMRG